MESRVSVARALGARFQVFTVDHRNHGRSPPSSETDYRGMAHDVKEFLEARRLDCVRWLGHSMGGKTAMEFALLYAEEVDLPLVHRLFPHVAVRPIPNAGHWVDIDAAEAFNRVVLQFLSAQD